MQANGSKKVSVDSLAPPVVVRRNFGEKVYNPVGPLILANVKIDSPTENETATIACQRCDLIVDIPALQAGEQAQCPVCNAPFVVRSLGGSAVSLACALAALVMLLLSCRYSFLSLGSIGITHELSLIEVPAILVENGRPIIALLFLLLTIAVPVVLMLLNIFLLIPYHFDKPVPAAAVGVLKWSHHLGHWSMVCLLYTSPSPRDATLSRMPSSA